MTTETDFADRIPRRIALQKGQQTRAAILDAALGLASHMGLEGLSIGALAEVTQMSKSGVFAHFGSREELQISVIREYHARFREEVFLPAVREPRGLPRVRSLFERWVKRVFAFRNRLLTSGLLLHLCIILAELPHRLHG